MKKLISAALMIAALSLIIPGPLSASPAILHGLASSAAMGAASFAPEQKAPGSASIDRNAHAFLFVLEFALGAPLTRGQEEIILNELRRGWETRSQKELSKFDAYPKIVEAIVKATDRQAVEDLRRELERSVREWLAESDSTDPAVAAVAAQLKQKGKILIPGNPPLTVMASDAYSEMYTYSELLQRVPDALPHRVSPAVVAKIKGRLLKAWARFTREQRRQVASTPGLWVSLRSVLQYGKAADRSQVLSEMKQIAAPREEAASSKEGSAVGNLVKHEVLMNIQNLTFNEYLFCHGFKSTIF